MAYTLKTQEQFNIEETHPTIAREMVGCVFLCVERLVEQLGLWWKLMVDMVRFVGEDE